MKKTLSVVLLVLAGLAGGFLSERLRPQPAEAARNASGTYSLPSGNPVVTGTTITSTWANTTLSDLKTEMTDSLCRSGKGAMLAPLRLTNGTNSAPSLTFDSDTDTGVFRAAANQLGLAAGGVQTVTVTSAGVTVAANTASTGFSVTNTNSGTAIYAQSTSGPAATFAGNATSAPLNLTPAAQPTSCVAGDLWVNSTGNKLNICTTTGTPGTWTIVGTQT